MNQQTLFDITTNILNRIKAVLEEVIYKTFSELLTDEGVYDKMSRASNSYGDGCPLLKAIFGLQIRYTKNSVISVVN